MSYPAGRRFEYRARDVFREFGYQCDRKAASSPYDLLVQRDGKTIFLVECKKTGKNDYIYISKEDITKLVKEAKKFGLKIMYEPIDTHADNVEMS